MEPFVEERLKICNECLLARKNIFNEIRCDSTKYMSPDGSKVSYLPKAGWINGCGCLINIAATNKNKKCVAGKWPEL